MCLHIMPVCPLPDGIATPMRTVGFCLTTGSGAPAMKL